MTMNPDDEITAMLTRTTAAYRYLLVELLAPKGQPLDDWLSIDSVVTIRLDIPLSAFSSIDLVQDVLPQRFALQERW